MDVLIKRNNFLIEKDNKSTLLYGKMMCNADFTLCVPIYGCGKYLKDTLDCIFSMNKYNLNIQILISDNKIYKEKNEVLELLKHYPCDNLAYYNSKKEMRQLSNFNRCFELANTEYIGMIHDDDLLVENYFKYLNDILEWLKKEKKIGILHGSMISFSEINDLKRTKPQDVVKIKRVTKFMISHYGSTLMNAPTCGIILKKEAVMSCGGFNPDFASSGDCFLGAVMINEGFELYDFKTTTGFYRIGNNISLKTDICKKFIVEDTMFIESWKKRNLFRKLYMSLFEKYLYSKNIDNKVYLYSNFNPDINIETLDYKNQYHKYTKLSIIRFIYILFTIFLNFFENIFLEKNF